jgi:hypothetical protein
MSALTIIAEFLRHCATWRYYTQRLRNSGYLLRVDEPPHPSCHICGAVVPAALVGFHQAWHDDQVRPAPRLFEGPETIHLDRLFVVVAALNAMPPVDARPEFIAGLRERLMTMAGALRVGQDPRQPVAAGRRAGPRPGASTSSELPRSLPTTR